MALPQDRIKVISIPEVVNEEQISKPYTIVPEMLGKNGYSAELPTLTANSTIALTSDIINVVANPVSTTGTLTGITIGNTSYAVGGSSTPVRTPLVTGTPATTVTLDPYKVYNFGTLTQAMVVSFNSALVPSGYCAEYTLRFTAGAGAAITLPNNVKINNGSLPTFTVGRVYEINIVDNLAVVGEFY